MPRGLGRLPFVHRLAGSRGQAGPVQPAPARAVDPDAAPVGPPLLLPAAIIRQVLYEATELVPAWALPRATGTAAIVASPAPAAPAAPRKRAKRAPAAGSNSGGSTGAPRSTAASSRPRPSAAKPRTRRAKPDV